MDTGTLYTIGKDMGLTGPEHREWVDAERARERDLRAQARAEQREKIDLEEKRLQAEERVLQLKLKLQEQAAIRTRELADDRRVATQLYQL
ncbi:hypothetical protein HPB50_002459 [Hyalomma asiaticum]|uniref:Uncharacterized protein n=1 Tax=Hyalomma asiaticum TaxID=266040 RepID=A0ACB7S0E9_HYAAI|nr:hypothetical protein HPB50_002459 [Hyalomma asiaticum]